MSTNDDKKNKKGDKKEDKEYEELKLQRDEYKAGWMRALADYQNLQKEMENRRSEWAKMSEAQVLEDFIPVYDNFKKAFNSDTDTRINADVADNADNESIKRWHSWKQGIEYIMKQFGDILKNYNIEEIKTVGEIFNPELHEAVGEEPTDAKAMVGKEGIGKSGVIVREVSGGYRIGDKIIKVAKVIVNK